MLRPAVILSAFLSVASAASARSLTLTPLDTTKGLTGPGTITLSDDRVEGTHAVEWRVPKGKSHGLTFRFDGRGVECADWMEFRFRYKVLTEGWTWFGIKLVDHPVGDGMQATWRIDTRRRLAPGGWREAVLDLKQPMYLWGNKPDTTSQWFCFRAQASGDASILLDDVRLVVPSLRVRLAGCENLRRDDGTRVYSWTIEATNPTKQRQTARVTTDPGSLRTFTAVVTEPRVSVAPGKAARVRVDLVAPPFALRAATPLSAERTIVRFTVESDASTHHVEIEAMAGLPPRDHPSLLVTASEIAAIKRKIERQPWARKAFDKLMQSAERAMKRTVKLPPRGGQWWHWYSCPKCGTRLKTQGPTKHYCPTCKTYVTGQKYDDVVLNRDHSFYARAIEDLGIAYQLTGEAKYAHKAGEILSAYAEKYLTYPRHNIHGKDALGGARVGPQTLDESTWLIPVVRGYDLACEALPSAQRKKIEDGLLRPAAELIMEHKMSIHNIQCWKNSAVGLVGMCIDEPRFIADAVTSPRGIHAQLEQGILDDGFWYEGAWGYHYYTMSALWPLAAALRNGGVDVFTDRYRGLYAAPLQFALPNGRLPGFNDSRETDAYRAWWRYELAYARWRDEAFAGLLAGKSRDSRESLLFGVEELAAGAKLPAGARNFPVSGYAYLQCDEGRDAPVAILDYAPHGGGHGHPEKLQLVLYAKREVVAPDPGCIHYGVPLHREWYKQTISHNTVVVDGRSQKACQGKLVSFDATPELAVASARADDAYGGVRFSRTVALLHGGLAVDLVTLESEAEHTYDWAFHAYGKLATPLDLDSAFAPPAKANGYQHIRGIRGCETDDDVAVTWKGAKSGVAIAMLGEAGTRVWAGDGRGQPSSRALPTVVVRRAGKSAGFATAFGVGDAGDEAPMLARARTTRGAAALVVSSGGTLAAVLLPGAAGSTPPEKLSPIAAELDINVAAPVALVRLDEGRLAALAFARGAGIARGDAVLGTSAKATASITYAPDGGATLHLAADGEIGVHCSGLRGAAFAVTDASGAAVGVRCIAGTVTIRATTGTYRIAPAGE